MNQKGNQQDSPSDYRRIAGHRLDSVSYSMPSVEPFVQRMPDLASSSPQEARPLYVSRSSTDARRGPPPCRRGRPRTCPPPASLVSRPLPWLDQKLGRRLARREKG